MTLVGQLLFTLPLMVVAGGSAWAFAASTAILSVVWVIASYDLARRVLPAPRAAFAVLTVLAIPGFLRFTTSYMTDVPTYAGEILCLTLGAAALRRTDDEHRWRWLTASLLVGCWAFSVREFALAAPVAVLIAAYASEKRGRWVPYVIAGISVVIACVAIYEFSQHLPGQTPAVPKSASPTSLSLASPTHRPHWLSSCCRRSSSASRPGCRYGVARQVYEPERDVGRSSEPASG